MAGLPVFYGSPVSRYAESHLDLIGLGHLLALSHRPGLNELACIRYRYEFGRDAVFTVPQQAERSHEKHRISGQSGGRVLYSGRLSMNQLLELVESGVKARTTEITESFTFKDYREKYPRRLVVFITDDSGHLQFPVDEDALRVPAGAKVTAFAPVDGDAQQA